MALSTDAMRKHVTTALDDAALSKLVAAAYADVTERVPATVVQSLEPTRGPILSLAWPSSSVTSVSDGGTLVAGTDYRVVPGSGQLLERLTAPCWTEPLVTYVSRVTDDDRDRVAIALVKLDVTAQPGMVIAGNRSQWAEEYANTEDWNYQKEREAILATLG